MAKAEICPVCNGSGKLLNDDVESVEHQYHQCHGCNGKGWVEVVESDYPLIYPNDYPWPSYPRYPFTPYYYVTYKLI